MIFPFQNTKPLFLGNIHYYLNGTEMGSPQNIGQVQFLAG
jgi:hypothetical protein